MQSNLEDQTRQVTTADAGGWGSCTQGQCLSPPCDTLKGHCENTVIRIYKVLRNESGEHHSNSTREINHSVFKSKF